MALSKKKVPVGTFVKGLRTAISAFLKVLKMVERGKREIYYVIKNYSSSSKIIIFPSLS